MKLPLLTLSTVAVPSTQGDADKVTRRQLRERAVELAAHEGRAPQDASKADWEQAKRELLCDPCLGFNAFPPGYQGAGVLDHPAGEATPNTPEWLL